MVERRPVAPDVAGSIPVTHPNLRLTSFSRSPVEKTKLVNDKGQLILALAWLHISVVPTGYDAHSSDGSDSSLPSGMGPASAPLQRPHRLTSGQ